MSDGHKEVVSLALTEEAGNNPPGVVAGMLADLKDELPGLFVDLSKCGRRFLGGKSAQEVAKAQQIQSEAIDRIGRLKMDEREQVHRHAIENDRHEMDTQAKRVELYESKLRAAITTVQELRDMGIDVDITAILNGFTININNIERDATVSEPLIAIEHSKEIG